MNLDSFGDSQLVLLRSEIEKEMLARNITISVGEIGENLAIKHFCTTPGLPNLKVAEIGTKNIDAYSRDGNRYTIKTSQKAKKKVTIYPDENEPEKQLFEYLLIVKLSLDFTLDALYRFSWQQFLKIRAWDKRMNAWYVPISKSRLIVGECLYRKDK